MHTDDVSERGCVVCLDSELDGRILYNAPTQKIDIFDSRAVT